MNAFTDPFCFVQLNFWVGRLFYPMKAFLDAKKPDLFITQEMLSGLPDGIPDFLTAEVMQENGYFKEYALGAKTHFMQNHRGMDRFICCGTFVKKIFSIKATKIIPIRPNIEPYRAFHNNILHTILTHHPSNTDLHVLNYHGRLITGETARLGTDKTDLDFQDIADYIKTLNGPLIFSGDLNQSKESSSLHYLKMIGLTNLNDVHGISAARNLFSWKPNEAVCHVFINDQVRVENYHVSEDLISDHYPLVMNMRIIKP
jgi:hypothetical protein